MRICVITTDSTPWKRVKSLWMDTELTWWTPTGFEEKWWVWSIKNPCFSRAPSWKIFDTENLKQRTRKFIKLQGMLTRTTLFRISRTVFKHFWGNEESQCREDRSSVSLDMDTFSTQQIIHTVLLLGIAIARALIKNPTVLILDEATR